MTTDTYFKTSNYSRLNHCIITGVFINLLLLSIILVVTGETDSWIWIPMLTVSISGVVGGIIFYFLRDQLNLSGWKKSASVVLAAIIHLIGFWLGLVFALAQVGLWD